VHFQNAFFTFFPSASSKRTFFALFHSFLKKAKNAFRKCVWKNWKLCF
jgi:hypothetical protein